MPKPCVLCDNTVGWVVEWYRDDDNDSGYGDNPQIATWYGTQEECRSMADRNLPPPGLQWRSIQGWEPSTAPGSAAWCETYGDQKE
jgi:hypothetical protein